MQTDRQTARTTTYYHYSLLTTNLTTTNKRCICPYKTHKANAPLVVVVFVYLGTIPRKSWSDAVGTTPRAGRRVLPVDCR
eukprot:scaffold16570_cov64-Phaeocystis_antarctica.AAC.4